MPEDICIEKIIIRNYKKEDRAAVRKICCDTAFMGQPMEIFFSGRDILADALTLYYTDYEPASLFVAEFKGKVVGYLMGCKDTAKKEATYAWRILPKTLFNFLKRGLIFNKVNILFIWHTAKSLLKGEFSAPEVPPAYPAHLHINIDANFRGFGLGLKLMQAFFDYLKRNNIWGIHLSTFSEQGRKFFVKTGFTQLAEGKTSQWRYILHKDVSTFTFGKILANK